MKSAIAFLMATQLASASAGAKQQEVDQQKEILLKGVNDLIMSGSEDLFANLRMNSNILVKNRAVEKDIESADRKHMGTARLARRSDLKKERRAKRTYKHQVTFAVKQNNIQELEKVLYDVSDHRSANYGKHWTREEVSSLTANPASTAHVEKYLISRGVSIVSKSMHGEYITAEAPISLWESLFATKFHEFVQEDNKHVKIVRAEEFSISSSLAEHLTYVFNVVDFPTSAPFTVSELLPAHLQRSTSSESAADGSDPVYIPGYVTPALLNQYYWIDSNTGSTLASQCVYESINQTYSPTDLEYFQEQFNLPVEPVTYDIGGHEWDDACVPDGGNNCGEANLDVQYLMGLSQNTPTTYYYDSDWMLSFVKSVADMEEPPLVISVSYGSPEPPDASYTDSFNTEAMKLGVMGVTILASSGDDGVAGAQARNKAIFCGYDPSFPASSPYVTAVGGTQGPETDSEEIACTSDTTGLITTGGGFSNSYAAPSWQTAQIAAYLEGVSGTDQEPAPGYNPNGRGYPDISAMAARYVVVMNMNDTVLFGTSASAPVVAGMVSLVNSARLDAGKSALGWINPSLYALTDSILLNDITSGENNCVAQASVCCAQGFYATEGWDPVTGLGTLNFTKFKEVFMALGDSPNDPTMAPSAVPGSPTEAPVISPTADPTLAPTAAPTEAPGWVTYSIYEGENCNVDTNAISITGVPTGQCFIQYNASYFPIGSAIYSCGELYATVTSFSDLECSSEYFLDTNELFLGCNPEFENYYMAEQKYSSSLQCLTSAGSMLPVTQSESAQYTIHTTYDDPEGCTYGSLSTFSAFLNGHCFTLFDIGSFSFGDLAVDIFLDTACAELLLIEVLDQTCSLSDDDAIIPFQDDGGYRRLSANHHPDTSYYDYYSTEPVPTTRLYAVWSESTGLVPTQAPTLPPSYSVELPVSQNLEGISVSEYNDDEANNNEVFIASVANFLPDGLDTSNVAITVVYGADSRRRRLATGDVSYINYTITFVTEDVSSEVDDITAELTQAVTDGSFTTFMQTTAIAANSALATASSTTVTFGTAEPVVNADDDTNDDKKNNKDDDDVDGLSDTWIIVIACGGGAFLILAAAVAYFLCCKKKSPGLLDDQA